MEKDTKGKLIVAALPLFSQKGYAGVSIRELAEAAGVNSASISYYFGGKDGLYEAVLKTLFSQLDTLMEGERQETIEPQAFAHEFAVRVMVLHKHNPYLVRYIHMEMFHPSRFFDTIIKEQLKKLFRFLCGGIEQAIAAGEFRSDLDVGFAAFSLSAVINMYYIVAPMRQRVMQRNDEELAYVEQAVDLFLNGARRKDYENTNT